MVPRYAHGPSEDAGMDLHAVSAAALEPGQTALVPTGVAIELPPGYEAQIRPRSGLALKYAITLPNSPATIDPGLPRRDSGDPAEPGPGNICHRTGGADCPDGDRAL